VNSSFSGSDGPLRVTLHQLDLRQNAQVSQSSSSQNYSLELLPFDDSDTMMKAAIKIPNPGCWQVTGHYKDQDLSFIVWVRVVQVDNHPLVLQGAVGLRTGERCNFKIKFKSLIEVKSLTAESRFLPSGSFLEPRPF
jgi:hypothetical protein